MFGHFVLYTSKNPKTGPELTQGLEVEGNKLAAHIPEELRHVVRGVHTGALGIDAAKLLFVVSGVVGQGRKGRSDHPLPVCLGPISFSWNFTPSKAALAVPEPPHLSLQRTPCRCFSGICKSLPGPILAPGPGEDTPQTPWDSWSVAPLPWSPRRMTSQSTCSFLGSWREDVRAAEAWQGQLPVTHPHSLRAASKDLNLTGST